MSWLIDTHVFIWFEIRSGRLPAAVRHLVSTTDEPVFLSAASIWEISIKRSLGKLDFVGSPGAAARASGFLELPIMAEHAEAVGDLAWSHRDPFDRLLAAQCQLHGLTLFSADAAFRSLPTLQVFWSS